MRRVGQGLSCYYDLIMRSVLHIHTGEGEMGMQLIVNTVLLLLLGHGAASSSSSSFHLDNRNMPFDQARPLILTSDGSTTKWIGEEDSFGRRQLWLPSNTTPTSTTSYDDTGICNECKACDVSLSCTMWSIPIFAVVMND